MEISLSEGNRHLLRPLVLLARDNFRFVGNPEVSIGPGGMRQVIAILSRVNHPPILLGTSSFTATGWQGSFYPKGMRSADYLTFYAEHFDTVEQSTAPLSRKAKKRPEVLRLVTHPGVEPLRLDRSECIPVLEPDDVLVPKFVSESLAEAHVDRIMGSY